MNPQVIVIAVSALLLARYIAAHLYNRCHGRRLRLADRPSRSRDVFLSTDLMGISGGRGLVLSDKCALGVEVGQKSLTFGVAYAKIWMVVLFGVFHCLWAGYVFSFLYYSPSKIRA